MGPEWAEKPLMVQVAPADASQAGSLQPVAAAVVLVGLAVVVVVVAPDQVQEMVELVILAALAVAQEEAPSVEEMTMTQTMIPTRGGKPVTLPNQQRHRWLGRQYIDNTSDQG